VHWKHGLNVYCEKPLARTLSEARILADLAQKTGAKTHALLLYATCCRSPDEGYAAGWRHRRGYHFKAHMFHGSYLDPTPDVLAAAQIPVGRRRIHGFRAHLVDLTRYFLGDVATLRASMRTFVTERPSASGSSQRETVDVDDWTLCTLELINGATGVVEVTRMAAGAGEATQFEIFGSRGALSFDYRHPESVSWV